MLSSISASDHNLPTGLVAFSPCDHSSLHDPLSGQIQISRHEVSGLRAEDASSWAVCLWGREQQQGWRWFESWCLLLSHPQHLCGLYLPGGSSAARAAGLLTSGFK